MTGNISASALFMSTLLICPTAITVAFCVIVRRLVGLMDVMGTGLRQFAGGVVDRLAVRRGMAR